MKKLDSLRSLGSPPTKNDGPGTVYLVGAGPGDPDLITVRGAQLLATCDALVYDALVPPSLVANSPAREKLYVGKTQGGHVFTQDEITRLILDLALRPGGPRRILRLKGGDPYIFGRGGEEALACTEAGVPFEVVPGVSAGVAAAAYAGVPVTHRSISRGVIFYTGHLAHGNLEHLPWASMAQSGFTLVSYMGVSTLGEIAGRLMAEGLSGDLPAMVVQEGTTPGQRSIRGTVADIAERARAAGIRSPAVTVIGKVVDLASVLGSQRPRPLAGKTVVLLKAEESSYEELEVLREAGARVMEASVVRCVPVDEKIAVSEIGRIKGDDVVLFTSAMAVRFFGEIWHALPSRPQPKVIAASPTVRRAALGQGLMVWGEEDTLLAEPSEGASSEGAPLEGALPRAAQKGGSAKEQRAASGTPRRGGIGAAAKLREACVPPDRKIWLPQSTAAGMAVVRSIEEAGYHVVPVPIYRAVPVPLPADVRSLLSGGRVDAVLFLSGSTVRAALEAAPLLATVPGVIFGAVGVLAAGEARALGIYCQVVPEHPRVADLVAALMATLGAGGDPLSQIQGSEL